MRQDALQPAPPPIPGPPTTRLPPVFPFAALVTLLAVGVVGLVGCQSGLPRFERSPLSYPEQVNEVLSVAPLGTGRDAAVEKLEQAGIVGRFSPLSRNVYYCDYWKRPDGSRWFLDVALLFNEDGEFYATRDPEAPTSVENGP